MTQYVEKIIDVTTGEETIRPYTAEEIAEVENAIAANEAKMAEIANQEAARFAVLQKLGLTEDELKILFP